MYRHPILASILTTALLVPLSACRQPPPPAEPDVYQLRGVVRQLPDPERPSSAFFVHHESVPDFKNADGEVVGMEPMAMPFEVTDPQMLAGLTAGDKIGFELEVHWDEGEPLRITRMEILSPEVRLDFERPSEDPASEDPASEDPASEDPASEDGAARASADPG